MEMYLQFAHGMKQLSIDLSRDWNGVTTILSPRDISPSQLELWHKDFEKANINTLFDPQYYYPKSNNKNLKKYKYWDSSFATKLESSSSFEEELTKSILEYNDIAHTSDYIIPSSMIIFDNNWLERWYTMCYKLIEATKKVVTNRKHILTIALPENVLLQREDEVEKILERCEKFDVDGFYIVAKTPQEKYLVDTPMWMTNLMQLCAGLKLQDKKVILGYGNHQMLCMTATGIDAMATGTFLNVRRFTNKFEENDAVKRKSAWYYFPLTLSEYKIAFLDTAYTQDVLKLMKPSKEMDNGYVDILFSGAMPSSVTFKETMAFKHYLNCVKIQIESLSRTTYKDTIAANEVLLETAMRRLEYMEKKGVYSSQARSFQDIFQVNLSALTILEKNRGFQLFNEWVNF